MPSASVDDLGRAHDERRQVCLWWRFAMANMESGRHVCHHKSQIHATQRAASTVLAKVAQFSKTCHCEGRHRAAERAASVVAATVTTVGHDSPYGGQHPATGRVASVVLAEMEVLSQACHREWWHRVSASAVPGTSASLQYCGARN